MCKLCLRANRREEMDNYTSLQPHFAAQKPRNAWRLCRNLQKCTKQGGHINASNMRVTKGGPHRAYLVVHTGPQIAFKIPHRPTFDNVYSGIYKYMLSSSQNRSSNSMRSCTFTAARPPAKNWPWDPSSTTNWHILLSKYMFSITTVIHTERQKHSLFFVTPIYAFIYMYILSEVCTYATCLHKL